jgi:hypothetical protein
MADATAGGLRPSGRPAALMLVATMAAGVAKRTSARSRCSTFRLGHYVVSGLFVLLLLVRNPRRSRMA